MNTIMYTASTVWGRDLSKKDIDLWLTNFKGEIYTIKAERLIALLLLSHFTFYNSNEVERLCRVVYTDLIHLVLTQQNQMGARPSKIIEDFFSKAAFIPSEAISGSGGFIGYHFRHVNKLPMTLFNFSIENVSDRIDNLITIDDVTLSSGTDSQIARFLTKYRMRFKSKNFYLLTLVSSQLSISYLKKTFGIHVIPAIQLDSRDKSFSKQSDIFASFPQLTPLCKKFAAHYGRKIGIGHPLGYADGQYAFAFFYNAPDNTLPIFWGQVNGWNPIVRRHHKNYSKRNFLGHDTFI